MNETRSAVTVKCCEADTSFILCTKHDLNAIHESFASLLYGIISILPIGKASV